MAELVKLTKKEIMVNLDKLKIDYKKNDTKAALIELLRSNERESILADTLKDDLKEINSLIKIWTPKAKKQDDAVSIIMKLRQERQTIIKKLEEIKPQKESIVDKFRKQREAQTRKTARKFK